MFLLTFASFSCLNCILNFEVWQCLLMCAHEGVPAAHHKNDHFTPYDIFSAHILLVSLTNSKVLVKHYVLELFCLFLHHNFL